MICMLWGSGEEPCGYHLAPLNVTALTFQERTISITDMVLQLK